MIPGNRMRLRVWHAAGFAILLAIIATAASVRADPCSGVPDCQLQTQSALKLKAWQTEGWAWYCGNGYPYFYNWSNSGKGISVVENPFAEGNNPSKFDATLTNWDPTASHSVTVTLGCSKVSKGGTCKSISPDPKCPTVEGPDNHCSQGPIPVCIQTWEEKCTDGVKWDCTDDLGVIWCNC